MGKSVHQSRARLSVLFAVLSWYQQPLASESKFGIGLKVGINKLEGDWQEPKLNPNGSLIVSYDFSPHIALNVELNASSLRTKGDATRLDPEWDSADFRIYSAPIELALQWNFAPLARINPFALLGGGSMWWSAKYQDDTLIRNGAVQRRFSPYAKAGGGVEMRMNPSVALALGADFRYTGSDRIDQFNYGDENDGLTSIWAGLSYSFDIRTRDDIDGDRVPRELDLSPWVAEDRNGYLDHDGRPDYGVPTGAANKAPVVIHHPVFYAEEGRDLHLRSKILSTVPLRVAAVLFRTWGSVNWNVLELEENEEMVFTATLDGERIQSPGFEYCVVAVDQRVKGIGYSGLPTRPIRVKVIGNATRWRIIGGIVSALSWGAASYVVFRKQN